MSDMSGMDMMDGTSGMNMTMKAYLHATIPSTDVLFFESWMPSNVGSVIGACVGLFFLAVLERFLTVAKKGAEVYWRRDALRRIPSNTTPNLSPSSSISPYASTPSTEADKRLDNGKAESVGVTISSYLPAAAQIKLNARRRDRWNVPFVWKNDLARGGIEFVCVAMRYLLMLTAMTFNIWYILAICLGAGAGETMFGRHGHLH